MDEMMKTMRLIDDMYEDMQKSQRLKITPAEHTGDHLLDSLKWPSGFDISDKKIALCAALAGGKRPIHDEIRAQIRVRPELRNYLRDKK